MMKPNIESLLEQLRKESEPSKNFEQKLLNQLQKHWVMQQSRSSVPAAKPPFFSFLANFDVSSRLSGLFGKKLWAGTFALAFMVVVSTGGISSYAYTSEAVTHESFLYPVKQAIESLEKTFISTPEDTVEFHLKMMKRRLAEIRHLSENQGIADEKTLRDFSTEFDQGVNLTTTLPEVSKRDVFFQKFENIISTHEEFFLRKDGTEQKVQKSSSEPVENSSSEKVEAQETQSDSSLRIQAAPSQPERVEENPERDSSSRNSGGVPEDRSPQLELSVGPLHLEVIHNRLEKARQEVVIERRSLKERKSEKRTKEQPTRSATQNTPPALPVINNLLR